MPNQAQELVEALGPAKRIIDMLLTHTDHAVHNRPGAVVEDRRTTLGVRWFEVTTRAIDNEKAVFQREKVGNKSVETLIGLLAADGKTIIEATITGEVPKKGEAETRTIRKGTRRVAEYRPAGLFPEVVAWMYRQVAEVWKLDNEFTARWGSYAFQQEHRDLKVILAAFLLVQKRKGDPILSDGKFVFFDDDFRTVGEAMLLTTLKNGKDFDPKLALRVHDVLALPDVAAINRELEFGKSARRPFFGRYHKTVEQYLHYREANTRMLEGLVKAGFRKKVMTLTSISRYRPTSETFFDTLRWKQRQAKDGHREIAIGKEVKAAESWERLSEKEICERIVAGKIGYKRIVGLLPKKTHLTAAMMAAAIDAGSLSDKDLVIYAPTLEDLGLLANPEYRAKWEAAVKNAEKVQDMRGANIATRMKSKENADVLQEGAEKASQRAVEEVMRGILLYVIVDISGSMDGAIEKAREYVSKFLPAFPEGKVRVAVFNDTGREVAIKHRSKAGVENAFGGIKAGGGTVYRSGVLALSKYTPQPEEDAVFFFVGDEGGEESFHTVFDAVQITPAAFGLLYVSGTGQWAGRRGNTVRDTALRLGIPCFEVNENTFNDVYAIPRAMRNLIAATPVTPRPQNARPVRESIIDKILATELLKKPAWAVVTT